MDATEMDEFEALMLEFLAYRRNKRIKNITASAPSNLIAAYHEPADTSTVSLAEIGMGWPHYKAVKLSADAEDNRLSEPETLPLNNPVIQQLEPIADGILSRFGRPDSPQALKQLTDHVIAKAMALPGAAESMRSREVSVWGRATLLEAVVALLIMKKAKL